MTESHTHTERERERTFATSPTPIPKSSNLTLRVRRKTVCMTALDSGRPTVTESVVERYMKEMAGARCEGSEMTACREMKTADWAMPVPKPLFGTLVIYHAKGWKGLGWV